MTINSKPLEGKVKTKYKDIINVENYSQLIPSTDDAISNGKDIFAVRIFGKRKTHENLKGRQSNRKVGSINCSRHVGFKYQAHFVTAEITCQDLNRIVVCNRCVESSSTW